MFKILQTNTSVLCLTHTQTHTHVDHKSAAHRLFTYLCNSFVTFTKFREHDYGVRKYVAGFAR
jgi:hypothetical protein